MKAAITFFITAIFAIFAGIYLDSQEPLDIGKVLFLVGVCITVLKMVLDTQEDFKQMFPLNQGDNVVH